jgi:hypothetical protein
MRVHSSNFKQIGFVTMPALAELTAAAHAHAAAADRRPGQRHADRHGGLRAWRRSRPSRQSVTAGADLVTFSGDKLLGGPQAGIVVGRAELVERLRRHPMARALRVDKLTLAALEATLHSYRRGRAVQEIPVWRMIAAPVAACRRGRQPGRRTWPPTASPLRAGWVRALSAAAVSPARRCPRMLLAVDYPAASTRWPQRCVANLRRSSAAFSRIACSSIRALSCPNRKRPC